MRAGSRPDSPLLEGSSRLEVTLPRVHGEKVHLGPRVRFEGDRESCTGSPQLGRDALLMGSSWVSTASLLSHPAPEEAAASDPSTPEGFSLAPVVELGAPLSPTSLGGDYSSATAASALATPRSATHVHWVKGGSRP